jgi:hypothetical protein
MKQVCIISVSLLLLDHEVLVEKPDAVKSIREQDIVEDDHHNVETTKDPSQEDDNEEEFDDNYES